MQVSKPYRFIALVILPFIVIAVLILFLNANKKGLDNDYKKVSANSQVNLEWQPPDTTLLWDMKEGELILYGKDLIANTSFYLGPKGKVAAITNGMNCQNCHLNAGTKRWGNNYSAVFSTYPKFRERSGKVETIQKRVNDCIERSLNGKNTLDTASREMKAIVSYMKWLGQTVPANLKPEGSGIMDLPFLNRPADPKQGKNIYINNCQRCHGVNGEGQVNVDGTGYTYPPLWGKNSYTTAAGLYRISRFAGFVKNNMPFDAPQNAANLTNEQAWDVAAFVNTQPRPIKHYKSDWPDIAGKPIDYPFGPYADSFTEKQHKYGPFEGIKNAKQKLGTNKP